MGKWYGNKTEGGNTSLGTEDLIKDLCYTTGYNYPQIIHFFFYCVDSCEIEVDGEPMWLEAETEIEFSDEFDLKKMPNKSFKILTADVKYQYRIIVG